MKKPFWARGQRAELAHLVGIHPNNLYEILSRRRSVSYSRAVELERASGKVLGWPIPWPEWINNGTSRHPAFNGKPQR